MYHGTSAIFGNRILTEQKLNPSRGDDHWLGDGQYFFRDDFYAFRWIAMKYTGNFQNCNKKINEIFDHYMILEAEIHLSPERIYSLCIPNMHINYLTLLDLLKEKQEFSERFRNKKIEDGTAINILFEHMGFGERYDAVEAIFNINTSCQNRTRFKTFSECQVCIKNADVIKKIVKFNGKVMLKQYLGVLEGYNFIKFGNTTSGDYSKKHRYNVTRAYKYK